MSTVTVPTRALVGMLADLALSASRDKERPKVRGVLLHTDTDGEYLVGTSTDLTVAAQAHTPIDEGEGFERPFLVSLGDVAALVKVFKPLVRSLGDDVHLATLELKAGVLTVREHPAQVWEGTTVMVAAADAREFPPVWETMSPDPGEDVFDQGVPIEPSYGTAHVPLFMEVFGKIGKRRQEPVMVFRHHQGRPVVVEIGARYRAVVRPVSPPDPTLVVAPRVPVFTPAQLDDTSD